MIHLGRFTEAEASLTRAIELSKTKNFMFYLARGWARRKLARFFDATADYVVARQVQACPPPPHTHTHTAHPLRGAQVAPPGAIPEVDKGDLRILKVRAVVGWLGYLVGMRSAGVPRAPARARSCAHCLCPGCPSHRVAARGTRAQVAKSVFEGIATVRTGAPDSDETAADIARRISVSGGEVPLDDAPTAHGRGGGGGGGGWGAAADARAATAAAAAGAARGAAAARRDAARTCVYSGGPLFAPRHFRRGATGSTMSSVERIKQVCVCARALETA